MSFHNHQDVHSQVGHQTVQGDVNHYHHHHYDSADGAVMQESRRLNNSGTQSQVYLDNSILESLAFPEMARRRRNIECPHKETCQWILDLDQYKQWINESSGLLWIKGKPGAGKSTLMSHLYSIMRINPQATTQQICLEHFFTARGATLERTSLGMFRSLVNQIFYLDGSIRHLLRAPYQHKQASFGSVHWQWQQQELLEIFTDLILASAQQQPILMFIDALDEVGKHDAEDLACYFHSLYDKAVMVSANLKIVISCRHHPVPPTRRAALEIHVEEHNHAAIASYVQDYIDNYLDNDANEPQPWQKLSETISNMANGVFQWVRLVLPLVRQRIEYGETSVQILRELPGIATDLDQVYKYIIEQVIDDKAQALRLFQWVCLASKPLSITELRYAIATHDLAVGGKLSMCHETPGFIETDERMKRCLRSWSGGLIEFVEVKSAYHYPPYLGLQVQPIHLSVTDFLKRQGFNLLTHMVDNSVEADRQTMNESRLSITQTVAMLHTQLYWSCLQYISSEEARFTAYDPYPDYLQSFGFPLAQYALSNVIYHAENAQGYSGRDLTHEYRLLHTTLPIWLSMWEVYDYYSTDRLPHGSTALHVAAEAGLDELSIHIMSHDCNVSVSDKSGQTALHVSAKRGKLAVVRTLLTAKADVNVITRDGETPLSLAARNGHTDVCSCLLQHGASPTTSSGRSVSALYAAVLANSIAIVRLCIDAGADVNARGGKCGNALQAASGYGFVEIVKILLDAGADVQAQGGLYGSALGAARAGRSDSVMQLLVKAGAIE